MSSKQAKGDIRISYFVYLLVVMKLENPYSRPGWEVKSNAILVFPAFVFPKKN